MIIGHKKRRILQLIKNSPTYGYKISKELNIPLSTVYGHLKYLKDLNLIEKSSENKKRQIFYILSTKGKFLLKAIED